MKMNQYSLHTVIVPVWCGAKCPSAPLWKTCDGEGIMI